MNNELLLTKEVLKNEVVSVNYYTLNGIKYGNKKDLLKALSDEEVDISLSILNVILGNHMVPKNITNDHPNLRFIDNATGIETRYY